MAQVNFITIEKNNLQKLYIFISVDTFYTYVFWMHCSLAIVHSNDNLFSKLFIL